MKRVGWRRRLSAGAGDCQHWNEGPKTTPESFRIWVDADACPNAVKEIVFRAAERRKITTTLVANQFIRIPKSKFINSIQVPSGFDVADNTIVAKMQSGDLVITAN